MLTSLPRHSLARSRYALLGAALASVATLASAPAEACGGFFCNAAQPVNQAAERILFAQAADGTVTATIQIQYSGDAEHFAWVLPVAGTPEVQVSSNSIFTALQAATNPTYNLVTTVEGTCSDDVDFTSPSTGLAMDGSVVLSDAGSGPIRVVDGGSVGPYDYVTIEVDPTTANAADAAVAWLVDNGYQIDPSGAALLEPYLDAGMNLLAFRLTKGNTTGSIRPVQISFGTGQASIPIRPTAVATVPDMGVLVWVLGPHRAVPFNYASLELNESLINWISPSSNYTSVVTEAANQAGGQGFVTEFAASSSTFSATVYPPYDRERLASIRAENAVGRESDWLMESLYAASDLEGLIDVVRATVPLPEGATYEAVLACPGCYFSSGVPDVDHFEPADFVSALQVQVIEPLERTSALFDASPYLTRLYTTMSASEMTRDPAFDFNADLPDVSNFHSGNRIIECSPSVSRAEAPWRALLPNGDVVRGVGQSWPLDVATSGMPANERILRYGTSGDGTVVSDNSAQIDDALAAHNATVPPPPATSPHDGLCAVQSPGAGRGPAPSAFALTALAALALVWRRRRSS